MTSSLVSSPPVLMAPRPDGFEVVWGVNRLSRGWIEWERSDERTPARGILSSNAFGLVPQDDRVLRVRVSGLEPGSELRVRAVTEAIAGPTERHESDWKRVRTLEPEAASAHIAVWNDTHERGETVRALHEATPAVDLLVWNGDLCNDWKVPDRFVETVLSPEGLDISDGRPLSIVFGNHDVRGTWAYQLEDFVATPDDRAYSAGRIGPVAFVILHTDEDKPDAHPTFEGRVAFEQLRAEQAEWLKEVITRPEMQDAPYRVVFCHIPLRWIDETPADYDSGGYDWFSKMSRDAWHDSLVAWGAQIVISGHTHEAVVLPATDEFPYVQLIAGGPDRVASAPEAATWTEITANANELALVTRDLDGGLRFDTRLSPLGM